MRFKHLSVFLLSAACFLQPLTGAFAAESDGFHAPWPDYVAAQDAPAPQNPAFAKREPMPSVPVMTPQTTQAVINALQATAAQQSHQPSQYARPQDLDLNQTAFMPVSVSALEDHYAKRTAIDLTQFGYELFNSANAATSDAAQTPIPAGAVQDDFILSIGDRLNITWRGQRNDTQTVTIDGGGQLILDDMPPVTAAGMNIGALRTHLHMLAQKQHNVTLHVTLHSVPQAGILIVGHVKNPGRKNLTVFHSVLDALIAAGGITKDGSLRQIKLVRQGHSTMIDLYSLFDPAHAPVDMRLRDGDRLIVPPIGPSVAIAGNVKRPAIYELLPAAMNNSGEAHDMLSLPEALALAGGVLSTGQNRFIRLSLASDGQENTQDITPSARKIFGNGNILIVIPSTELRAGTIELKGHTRKKGVHAAHKNRTLSALLAGKNTMGPDIYPLIGIIERQDKKQLGKALIAFSPLMVRDEKTDVKLQDGDIVHLFSRTQIETLRDANSAAHYIEAAHAAFLRERSAFVRGALRHAGAWPVAEGTTLENIIAAAGGLTLEANQNNIEITKRHNGSAPAPQRRQIDINATNPATIQISAGDSVRVNQQFKRIADSSVLIIGEVNNPGRYDLLPGDRMSDLLARAGGISAEAYPDGAIFSRESERRAEESRFRAQAQDLEMKLAQALKQKEEPDAVQIKAVQDLVTQLQQAEALGRITVEADPAALAADPELDILLQAGDRIYIPKRPLTVRVAGEVLSPANLQFRKDRAARDYIMQAGGYSWHADANRVFVVFPDGSAQPLSNATWRHNPVLVPPGSTIIVPRNPKPFDFIETARDLSQILSNLAITGIFVRDLRDD